MKICCVVFAFFMLISGTSPLAVAQVAVEVDVESSKPATIEVHTDMPVEESRAPLDADGRMVNFQRDIAPILIAHCLECHGPKEAKNDFRVDDVDSLMGFIEPEDAESSGLYTDYLVTDDPDMLMPPASHGGPLSPSELALIRVWISEGAMWPEDYKLPTAIDATVDVIVRTRERSLAERVWAFQGYLHPATVHFPIAMLLVGALFVVLGLKWPTLGTQVPVACLVIGGLGSVVATAMGWSFATEMGYGSWTKVDFDSEVFWHRWSGVVLTLMSVGLIVIMAMAFWKDSPRLMATWKVGLVVAAIIVGLVGHQGGDLNYGKDFYPKAFRILLGSEGKAVTTPTQVEVIIPSEST